ncbi:hypothetical protein EDB86DRAFT_2834234 [Lactarius hatsudake]|nr:hypothetical protein EDB86DRAFT_2834234 [Lactarius hatsudake]
MNNSEGPAHHRTQSTLFHNDIFVFRGAVPSVPVATTPIQRRSLFADARVLNTGASFTSLSIACVSSEVPQLLAQSWGAQRVVGVDIDDALVLKAWRRRHTL